MKTRVNSICAIALAMFAATPSWAEPSDCKGSALAGIRGLESSRLLSDGTLAGRAKVNINIDGYGRAYHPANAAAGAVIHLCNAGEVFLPNGAHYYGSIDNATCTGKFMADFERIRAAKWQDPSVGAIRWFGILGKGSVKVNGRLVEGVEPAQQPDGSGFFVSPTKLADGTVKDQAVQSRYVHPLRVRAAVIPNQSQLRARGIVMGSFGVAFDPQTKQSVPFIVGDFGPRVGEATPALARSLAGLPLSDTITRKDRYTGQVDEARVVWVFFGGKGGKIDYRQNREAETNEAAQHAFDSWGGASRLECLVSAIGNPGK